METRTEGSDRTRRQTHTLADCWVIRKSLRSGRCNRFDSQIKDIVDTELMYQVVSVSVLAHHYQLGQLT